jgi:hypothetical protein
VDFSLGGGQHVESAREALAELSRYMTENGWEPQPGGVHWYNLRFRHRALSGPEAG